MAKVITKTTPDKVVNISIKEVFAKLDAAQNTGEEAKGQGEVAKYAKAVESLSPDEKIALCTYIGRRIEEFQELFDASANSLAAMPVTAFPGDNALISVGDLDDGETVGGLSVATETKTVYSTRSEKGRSLVLEALKTEGITDQYTKTTTELNNEKIATAQANGTLPAAVSNVFKKTETSKRVVKFQKLATEKVEK